MLSGKGTGIDRDKHSAAARERGAHTPCCPAAITVCIKAVSIAGERHELSDLLDAATQKMSHLEAANVQHGDKEASLKDKVGPDRQHSAHKMNAV